MYIQGIYMNSQRIIKLLLIASTGIAMNPMVADHGGSIAAGFMGAGLGMMTGMAIADHHHCHEVIYTHESRPSREWLEEQIEYLEQKLQNADRHISSLEHELGKKDSENHRLKKKLKYYEQGQHHSDKTEIVFSAKAVTQ